MTIGDGSAAGLASGVEAETRRWQAAEGRLYPLIVADPDLYQLAVRLVVEARDVLRRDCATVTALIECDPAGVLSGCPSAPLVREQGFDPAVAFDAARAQLLRELSVGPEGDRPGRSDQ